jgi:NAD(P)-dependent dehydrogenase (short-subunit alcohol dehydrogenase family)
MNRPLAGQVAVVAGATRGAGRGIARALGEAGAFVYCTGRSVASARSEMDRPETIDETAALIVAAGGRACAVQLDHTRDGDVGALATRALAEAGRVDILVNSLWGADPMVDWGQRAWEFDVAPLRKYVDQTVLTHIVTTRAFAPAMVAAGRGLVIEVIDGHFDGYRGHILYDFAKAALARFAYGPWRSSSSRPA